MRATIGTDYPNEFDEAKAPDLYIQLRHYARDRGAALNLDAWTGELDAVPVQVKGDKW